MRVAARAPDPAHTGRCWPEARQCEGDGHLCHLDRAEVGSRRVHALWVRSDRHQRVSAIVVGGDQDLTVLCERDVNNEEDWGQK